MIRQNFLQCLKLAAHSMIAFDRAYKNYLQFARWTEQQVNFVCLLKKDNVYTVEEIMYEKELAGAESGVLRDERIRLDYKRNNEHKKLCLRKVIYWDGKGRLYQFITNNFEITVKEVALLHKLRWNIELLFKKLKQNFQLHYFYSETKNGIKTKI